MQNCILYSKGRVFSVHLKIPSKNISRLLQISLSFDFLLFFENQRFSCRKSFSFYILHNWCYIRHIYDNDKHISLIEVFGSLLILLLQYFPTSHKTTTSSNTCQKEVEKKFKIYFRCMTGCNGKGVCIIQGIEMVISSKGCEKKGGRIRPKLPVDYM